MTNGTNECRRTVKFKVIYRPSQLVSRKWTSMTAWIRVDVGLKRLEGLITGSPPNLLNGWLKHYLRRKRFDLHNYRRRLYFCYFLASKVQRPASFFDTKKCIGPKSPWVFWLQGFFTKKNSIHVNNRSTMGKIEEKLSHRTNLWGASA